MGARDALLKYNRRFLKDIAPKEKSRRNKKPEKELTQKPCLKWMRDNGWSVEIYEAKAAWDPVSGSYANNFMKAGTVDCIGNDNLGLAVYVEFKAPGKLSNLSDGQREFLRRKIESGAFGVCTDTVDRLARLYNSWLSLRKKSRLQDAQRLLFDELVPRRKPQGK